MSKRTGLFPIPRNVRHDIAPEQILAYFNIPINDSNKCLCPFHTEKTPSMQVNEHYVYCFGCHISLDSFRLVCKLLEKQRGRAVSFAETITWLLNTKLPDKSTRTYTLGSPYQGDVPPEFVAYYQQCMTDDLYARLEQERLITKATAMTYRLGWRPDWEAWAIPFYRGAPGTSRVDVLQFRLTNSPDKKYVGLTGYNRGTVMNAALLEQPQRYVVILFGSFDAILAQQDGILAVGLNGCSPFKKSDTDRLKDLFKKQYSVFVVPDNSPGELPSAYALADLLGGQVRLFPTDMADGTDYIDYRKAGFSALDFLQDILQIEPITQPDSRVVETIVNLWKTGDPLQLASVRTSVGACGQVAADIARELAKRGPVGPFTPLAWASASRLLWNVKSSTDLFDVLDSVSQTANLLKTEAW